ncbi:hypothetical protein B296_00031009 [Ensete ventricosum]|uniref:Uncharacterized protein n=1 Tax=Ensete ventricosum TaxID=4639 RepID=A0A426Y0H3_ENSVE|nr:hypothetical protein B296_00031009 [Ensete ventricosum]
MDNKTEGLWKEVAELKAESGSEAVATAKLQASEAQALVDHLKAELEEATHRRESLELDFDNSRLLLADSKEQLKDGLKVELPQKVVAEYKGSVDFKMGLVWTGHVSYEYGCQVALTRFRARYLDLEVGEDPRVLQ